MLPVRNEAYKSFSSIPILERHDTPSFESLKDSLSKDSLNAKWHFLLGEHYSETGEIILSTKYYYQALDYLNMSGFKDSSELLTRRGIINFKLARLKDSEKDFVRSLSLNPNDPVAFTFYMVQLISSGRFTVIREICENGLNKENDQGQITSSYCWLIPEELLSRLSQIMAEIDKNTTTTKALQQMYYQDLFNFRLIDKYYKKYKNPPNDLKRILTLRKWFFAASNQLNEYSQKNIWDKPI